MKRLLLLALLAACATSQGASKPQSGIRSEVYAPYAVGASWTYSINYLGEKAERRITIVTQEDGYFVDDQQGRFRHTEEGLRDPQRFLIKHPIEEGHSWKAIVSASAVEHYRITGVGESCEAKAGRFEDCLIVESRLRRDEKVTLHARWTWAKGIGLVKIETEADIVGKGRIPQTTQSLLHYALKPSDAQKKDDGPSTWSK